MLCAGQTLARPFQPAHAENWPASLAPYFPALQWDFLPVEAFTPLCILSAPRSTKNG